VCSHSNRICRINYRHVDSRCDHANIGILDNKGSRSNKTTVTVITGGRSSCKVFAIVLRFLSKTVRRQILVKILCIEFHENPFCGLWLVPRGQTDVYDAAKSRFSQLLWERAKKLLHEPCNLMWRRTSHQRLRNITVYVVSYSVNSSNRAEYSFTLLLPRLSWCLVTGVIFVSYIIPKPSPSSGCGSPVENQKSATYEYFFFYFCTHTQETRPRGPG
jgi:hypothetical protein